MPANKSIKEKELLPCPFCGSMAERAIRSLKGDTKLYTTGCFNRACMVAPYTKWQPYQELADEKWNTRA